MIEKSPFLRFGKMLFFFLMYVRLILIVLNSNKLCFFCVFLDQYMSCLSKILTRMNLYPYRDFLICILQSILCFILLRLLCKLV